VDTNDIDAARSAISSEFLRGNGIEVGGGSRPFPVPAHATVSYGDIRDRESLRSFFKTPEVVSGAYIDAQTFAGLADDSLDFVISAHVIEHLRDPIGSIVNALRVLRPGGIHVIVMPELSATFDRHRPETTVAHALADYADGGEQTCRQSYEEHLRFVHPYLTGAHYPEDEIQRQATESARRWRELDVHFHAWTRDGFEALLAAVAQLSPFRLEKGVSVANENIFVLRKNELC
jgi:SAM-dependent methyltransferase